MAAENEKRIPVFEWVQGVEGGTWGDFKTDMQGRVVTVTGPEAAEQVILKALRTVRGIYAIYADPANTNNNHKYGNDTLDIMTRHGLSDAVRLSEMQRTIKEALEYDPWIVGVSGINIVRQGDTDAVVSLTVKTIFDTINLEGVQI